MVLLKVEPGSPFSRDELMDILRAENALVRPHHHTPLADTRFPIADRIAGAFIRMPGGPDHAQGRRTSRRPVRPAGGERRVHRGSISAAPGMSQEPPDLFEPPLHVGQLNRPPFPEFRSMVEDVFARGVFTDRGPLEQTLDRALAEYFEVHNAISVVNGTAALMLLLRALDVQGEVITTAFTFPATLQALTWAGLVPVFCDVDPRTHVLSAVAVEAKIGPATAAIIGVHIWGRGCDPVALEDLARRRGLKLVFDAAHATGCTFEGRRIGGFGDAEIFSFHATKILNGAQGGCITTDDDDLATRLRKMRDFGEEGSSASGLLRLNAGLSEAQAAMALLGLRHLPDWTEENRRRYELYRAELAGIPGVSFVD